MSDSARCAENRVGMVRPVVDFNRCEGKRDCVEVCPYEVFEVRKIDPNDYSGLSWLGKFKNRVHGGLVAYTPKAGECHACGLCIKACPEQAIKLERAECARQDDNREST